MDVSAQLHAVGEGARHASHHLKQQRLGREGRATGEVQRGGASELPWPCLLHGCPRFT